MLSAGGRGRLPRNCVHCHLGGHKKCRCTVSALPTMVYYGDAPPRHLHRGEHGVKRAHLTGARGKGLGVVREQDRLSNPVEDDDWDYAMCIVWGALPRSICEPVLLAIEEYLHHRSHLVSMCTPFEKLEVAGAGPRPHQHYSACQHALARRRDCGANRTNGLC